jgi:hypothetical protein
MKKASSSRFDVERENMASHKEVALQVENHFIRNWMAKKKFTEEVLRIENLEPLSKLVMVKQYFEQQSKEHIKGPLQYVNFLKDDFNKKFDEYKKENQRRCIDITEKLAKNPQDSSLLTQLKDIKKEADNLANDTYKNEFKKNLLEEYVKINLEIYSHDKIQKDYDFIEKYKEYLPKEIKFSYIRFEKLKDGFIRYNPMLNAIKRLTSDSQIEHLALIVYPRMRIECVRMLVEKNMERNYPDAVDSQVSLLGGSGER